MKTKDFIDRKGRLELKNQPAFLFAADQIAVELCHLSA